MDLLSDDIAQYAEAYTFPETPVLSELNRETNTKVLMPQMLSGHLQGRILSLFSHLLQPKRVLEIGTYTGYSAICLAEGLLSDGLIYTIDINDELKPMSEKYFAKAGYADKIRLLTGDALTIIPTMNEVFDLVFIDADKKNYSAYFDLVIGKVRSGGLILADNVLWSGKVLEPESKMDKDTLAITAFNRKIREDVRIEPLLLPVRDGLMIMRVK